MKEFSVVIEGVVPVLFNRFTEAAQKSMTTRTAGKKMTDEERIQEAYGKVYEKDGYIGVPAMNVKKCILEGCGFAGIKIGRRSAVPYMRGQVFVEPDFVATDKSVPDGIHECSGRIPPRTGARAMIRRPYLEAGWTMSFNIVIVADTVGGDIVKLSLEEGGQTVGLCDHRPEFGRFRVNQFKKVKQAKGGK